jgi:hypothetical protein
VNAAGPSGELRVGYQQAASLGLWEIQAIAEVSTTSFAIKAEIRNTDSFWITQTPMTVDLQFGRFHWLWYFVRPVIDDGYVAIKVFGKPSIVKE